MNLTWDILPKAIYFSDLIIRSRYLILTLEKERTELPVLKRIDDQGETDFALVDKTLKGNLPAFDKLVRRYQGMVTGSLFRFCPHRSDLEDLVQETMIKAYRKLDTWNPTVPFEYWIRRIAINTGHDYFRRKARNPVAIADKLGNAFEADLESVADKRDNFNDYLYTEQIQNLLEELPIDDRTLLTLQYLEGMTIAEIADSMGWGLSKTKVKSHRAKKKLKKLLSKHEISET